MKASTIEAVATIRLRLFQAALRSSGRRVELASTIYDFESLVEQLIHLGLLTSQPVEEEE